jgi:hypothetical protein
MQRKVKMRNALINGFGALLTVAALSGVPAMAESPGHAQCRAVWDRCFNDCPIGDITCRTACGESLNRCFVLDGRIDVRIGSGKGITAITTNLTPDSGTNVKGPVTTGGGASLSATLGTAASASTLGKTSGPASIATKPLPAISATIGGATMGGSRNGGRVNMQAK